MSSPPETLKILLVEDEDDDRVFINRAFSRSRYDAQIVEASTLKDARELATDPQYQFDVAVVDQLLPDGNGLDF
ncbi:MAG: response regulator, partial [Pseudomonadota bacterium]